MQNKTSLSLSALLTLLLLCPASTGIAQQAAAPATGARDLFVTVGKSLIVDSPRIIQRVAIANGEVGEAFATSPKEVIVNGKAPGETSLIIWQDDGNRLIFDLNVMSNTSRVDNANRQLRAELPGQDVTISVENGVPFVKGLVKDVVSSERAMLIASTLGRPTNLLHVEVPPVEAQILIKVKFADVDRSSVQSLGLNFFSTGAANTIGSVGTQQFTPPFLQSSAAGQSSFTLSDALNIFFFRPDLNLGATIKALQARSVLQILAEPNVLTINNRAASFLAGGEFPFPMLQGGGAGLGAVTISFREFGIRIRFLPIVTPRGTIRLQVTPEVSSLDYSNGLIVQGYTIPALATRRVQTEIELDSGQSFAIGGLLDNRTTESLNKIPGLGDIPFFGKLFTSRNRQKNNSELLVIVTPEVVRPIPAGQPLPSLKFPHEFLPANTGTTPPRQPGVESTGPVPVIPKTATIPIERLLQSEAASGAASSAAQQPSAPQIQFVPVVVPPAAATGPVTSPAQAPGTTPPPAGSAPAPSPTRPPSDPGPGGHGAGS
jgi:pilus assembly protein CpaC